jgi:NhaA family Na+:H+ antiporter
MYQHMLNLPIAIHLGTLSLSKPLLLWVNEGLMALFFCYVTLEIKHEMLSGSLSQPSQRIFPFWAAIGGMLVPALCYFLAIGHNPHLYPGWAIPTATDIVFALCLLSVAYPKAPISVRSFLLALAVFDDIGAILIIALYYSNDITWLSMLLSAILCAALVTLQRMDSQKLRYYVLLGLLLWLVVLKSGVHATVAGIIVALALPNTAHNASPSLSAVVEQKMAYFIGYFVLPLFAFVNSGIILTGVSFAEIFHTLPMAITLGLFLGKQMGITLMSYIAVRFRLAALPDNMDWLDVYGVSIICGIGFTMSLFIGTLAFDESMGYYALWVRVGVIAGSVLSALYAYIFFNQLRKT